MVMHEDKKVFEKDVPGLGNVKFFIDESANGVWLEVRKSNGEWGWAFARNCADKLEFGHARPEPSSF
jgi:hypothetical protein